MNFVSLLVGKPSKAALYSLSSINQLKPSRICIMADETGSEWLKENFDVSLIFCLHKIPPTFYSKYFANSGHLLFESYGTKQFSVVTMLKFVIILDVFKLHKDINDVIFSDLDVFWKTIPRQLYDNNPSQDILTQGEKTSRGTKRSCTGVIYLLRGGLDIITRVYRYQDEAISTGDFIHDERAFNRFISSSDDKKRIGLFSDESVVLGPRIWTTLRNWDRMDAYHANYLRLDHKAHALAYCNFREKGKAIWIYKFLLVNLLLIKSRVKNLLFGLFS